MYNCMKLLCLLVAVVMYVSGQCDMHITYDATIATSQDEQGPKSYIAEFNMHNHNSDVEAWRLAFKLNTGEQLADVGDVLTSDVYVDPESTVSEIAVESANLPIKNGEGGQVKFIGTKDLSKYNATVAAVTGVEFNNIECEEVQEKKVEAPAYVNASDYKVEIDFRSVELTAKDGSSSQQQQIFHLDVVSLSPVSLYLPYMKIQYYFSGGMNDMFAKPQDYIAVCVASETFICPDLTFNITTGVQGVDGADYMLEIGFKEKSGYLLHNTTGDAPMITTVPQTKELAYQMISFTLALESQIAYNYLDISKDYSSIETEVKKYIDSTSGGKISQRSSEPNNKVPVYYSDDLVAGVTPQWEKYQFDSENGANEYDPTSCVVDEMSGDVYCSVHSSYCCVGDTSAAITLTASPEPITPVVTTTEEPATVEQEDHTPATVEQEDHTPAEAHSTIEEDGKEEEAVVLKSATLEEAHSDTPASTPSGEETTIESSTVVLVILLVIVVVLVVAGLVVFIQRRRASGNEARLQVELRSQSTGENQSLNQYYDQAREMYK
eukprot:TRINITY_DN934_c0_g1_i2.p1 TRINITY_DN934_c0_g1~~TRINITY_DN934_c0_g1_i2.p1  ORF type:complete len:550 (-),score=111.79 TRINITY_DN934_c0_g1_i2:429-2078(-)